MNASPDGGTATHLVFSYGTLQQSQVQASLFGGPVPTTPDEVVGHTLVPVHITDPVVVALSGSDTHTGLVASTGPDRLADRVPGAVLRLTAAQLSAADTYESAYTRLPVPLASGGSAWAYLLATARAVGAAGADDGQRTAAGGEGGLRRVTIVLSGLGSVGTSLLRLIDDRAPDLAARHGLSLTVVAALDSRGAAVDPDGLDLSAVLVTKGRGASTGDLEGVGRPTAGMERVLAELDSHGVRADVLVEAGPANLTDGGTGLAAVLTARQRGMSIVLANKAPLVVAWDQIIGADAVSDGEARSEDAITVGTALPPIVRYSACVGAALPTVEIVRSVLVSARVTRLEIVLNSTCQRVLGDVEGGLDVDDAIAAAQAAGLAEADPSMDVDGTDTAVKLAILSAALGHPKPLSAVEVTGIRGVTPEQAEEARQSGQVLVLLGVAEPTADTTGWRLTVAPEAMPADHPLARMDRHETGVVVHTDIAGRIAASGRHHDVTATGAAVLRDVVMVAQQEQQREQQQAVVSGRVG